MSDRVFIRRNGEVLPLEVKRDKTKASGFGVELHAQRPDVYLAVKLRELGAPGLAIVAEKDRVERHGLNRRHVMAL